jgi:phage-related minor tail protein
MDGLTAAYDMFGKSGDQIYAAVQNGTLNFTDLAAAATDSSGSVAAAYEEMLDPADEATMAMNQAKLAGAEIGNTLMTIAAPAIQKVAEGVKDLKDKWDGLSPSQQENIVKFGLLAAAIGPVIVIGGTLISTIGSIIGVAGTLVSGIGAVVGVLGGPLTLAIGAAIAAGVLLYQNWDTVKQKVTDLATGVKQKWEDIKTAVKSGVDKLKNLMNFKWELPKLKLPHFSISGEFSLNPPSIPHINVEWYAKAMQNGVILRNPTVFGAAGGNLLGAGEAGPEVVVGASSLFDMIRTAVGSTTNNYGGNNVYVYGAPGQDVHELAMEIADIIHADVQTKGAVWA